MRAESCSRCTGPVVQITITLAGEDVTMSSCSRCDHRSWRANGRVIDLRDVLTGLGVGSDEPTRAGHDLRDGLSGLDLDADEPTEQVTSGGG